MGPNMPSVSTSVVCEPSTTTIASNNNNSTVTNSSSSNGNNNNNNSHHSIGVGSSCSSAIRESLAASASRIDQGLHTNAAKRSLELTKVEYERAPINFQSNTGDVLKKKYTVLKATSTLDNTNNHNNNCNGSNGTSTNGMGASASSSPQQNGIGGSQLPVPKRCLYDRELVQIGWKQPSGRHWSVGSGMSNVGNTCYLNSTLQALFHVPSFANWLYSDDEHRKRCEATNSQTECIICAMARTLQDTQSTMQSVKPHRVYSKLRQICRHLLPGHQEDAHEFLRYLVEAMEKVYLLRFKNSREFDQMTKETTPLNQMLGGYLKSSVRCMDCSHVSVTFQHFQDLLLDIRKCASIEEALDTHFARERLEDMGYKCESCKKKVSATKQFSLERAPIALCIQLKRFSMMGGKLNKHITFGTRLNLSKYSARRQNGGNDPQMMYRLVSMVTHLGSSQHCGHYTAVGLASTGAYYTFDDSSVRSIGQQSVVETNAYIMFYELEDSTAITGNSQSSNNVQSFAAVSTKLAQVTGPNMEKPKTNGFIGPLMANEAKQKTLANSSTDTKVSGAALVVSPLTPPTPPKPTANHNNMAQKMTSKLVLPISQTKSTVTTWNSKFTPHTVRANAATSNGNGHSVPATTNGLTSNGNHTKAHNKTNTPTTLSTSSSSSGGNNNNGRPQTSSATLPCMPNLDFSTERHSNLQTTPISSSTTASTATIPQHGTSSHTTNQQRNGTNGNHARSTAVTPPSSPDEKTTTNGNGKNHSARPTASKQLVPYASSSDEETEKNEPIVKFVKTKAGDFQVSNTSATTQSLSPAASNGSNGSCGGVKRSHSNAFAPNAVTEASVAKKLQENSHSGYGAPINSWNGQSCKLEQELKEDRLDENRRRQAIDVDADMDVGRQRKTKTQTTLSQFAGPSNPEYNHFQGTQNSINRGTHRWTNDFNGGGGNNRKQKAQNHNNNNNHNRNPANHPHRFRGNGPNRFAGNHCHQQRPRQ